ncbi:MAG: hypothetical protein COV70_02840 [Parcubacteria group bacterium CG11_big_fil_rev_8_21_14_0_20_39_22]|nr:MAG: hypothetical protein COV70_02840 [Parcubacteria group bacterium CG11_big_fil_rev_8_21_14_0_20_39_22]
MQPRLKDRQRSAKRRLIAIVAGAVLIFLVSVLFILRIDSLQIQSISVRGDTVIEESQIVDSSYDVLSGNWFFVIPKSSIFLFPKNTLKTHLLETFPRFEEVSIDPLDLRSLSVVVKDKGVVALWCSKNPDKLNGIDQCYSLDEEGFVFARGSDISGNIYKRFYGVLSGNPIGSFYASPWEFQNMRDFLSELESLNLSPNSYEVTDNLDRIVTLASGTEIKIDSDRSFESVKSDLKTVVQELQIKGIQIENLLYIDLRFKDKMFYKEKQELVTPI